MSYSIDDRDEIEDLAHSGNWTERAAKKVIKPGKDAYRMRAIQYAVACFNYALEQDDFSLIKFHPLAEVFPPMAADDFAALKSSIAKDSAIREQISVAPDGRIVDGSNRVRALFELVKEGMAFRMMNFDVDCPIQNRKAKAMSHDDFLMHLVMAKNLARRHLEARQKAAVLAKATAVMSRDESSSRANAAQGKGSTDVSNDTTVKSDTERAKEAGISRATLARARKTRVDDPEMADAEIKGKAAVTELKSARQPEPTPDKPDAHQKALKTMLAEVERYGALWGFNKDASAQLQKITREYKA